MDSDPAEHGHGLAAGPDPYAYQRRPARQGVLADSLRWLRAAVALSHGRSRRPAEECGLGGGDHRDSRRNDPRACAAHGGDVHDALLLLVAAARRSWRAALLGADPARFGARADRIARRRVRFWLWLLDRNRRPAACLFRAGD